MQLNIHTYLYVTAGELIFLPPSPLFSSYSPTAPYLLLGDEEIDKEIDWFSYDIGRMLTLNPLSLLLLPTLQPTPATISYSNPVPLCQTMLKVNCFSPIYNYHMTPVPCNFLVVSRAATGQIYIYIYIYDAALNMVRC